MLEILHDVVVVDAIHTVLLVVKVRDARWLFNVVEQKLIQATIAYLDERVLLGICLPEFFERGLRLYGRFGTKDEERVS